MNRAPKGGVEVNGVFYKGGQFLPSNEPQHGKYNRKATIAKTRKVEIAPYTWVVTDTPRRTLYSIIQSTGATYDPASEKFNYSTNAQAMSYFGITQSDMMNYVDRFNSGERWV